MTHEHKDGCCGTGTADKSACCNNTGKTVTILAVVVAIASLGYAFSVKSNSMPLETGSSPTKVDASTLITGEDTVVAKLNGKDIKKSDVALAIKDLGANVPPENLDQILPAFVDQYINLRLINDAADKEGVDKEADVQQQLYTSRDQIVRAAYLRKLFDGKLTDEALKETYKTKYEAAPMPQEVRARHILVDDEGKAKELIARLAKGESFEKLASENSKDPSAARGGDLGYFAQGEMVKEFGDAAFAMSPGQMTQEPVKTQFGYHIIKVEDKRTRAKPSFEEAKSNLEQEARQTLLDAKLQELRAAAKIENLITAQPAPGTTPPPAEGAAPAAPTDGAAAPAPAAPAGEMPAAAPAPAEATPAPAPAPAQ